MIYLIIKSYFVILLSIGMSSLALFLLGVYFILRLTKEKPQTPVIRQEPHIPMEPFVPSQPHSPTLSITSKDIKAIAGDDVIATQLDLARAYVESGRKKMAANILEHVVKYGSDRQQDEAKSILANF